MGDDDKEPIYDYGDDVNRYLVDKGLSLDDLTKKHKRNVAAAGHIDDDPDAPAGQRLPNPADVAPVYATPVMKKPEKWVREKPSADVDWSKVLEKDPDLPENDAMAAAAKVKSKKARRLALAAQQKKSTKKKKKNSTKKAAPTRAAAARVKETAQAYDEPAAIVAPVTTLKGKNRPPSSKGTKMSKEEKKAMAAIAGAAVQPRPGDPKFIPKKTQDDECQEILAQVLGGHLGEHVVRHAVQTSPFFSSDPATAAKLKALTKEPAMKAADEAIGSAPEPRTRRLDDDGPEMQSGVVGVHEGAKKVENSQTLNYKLETLVKKINSRADQPVVNASGAVTASGSSASDASAVAAAKARAANRAPMTTEDIVIRSAEAGVNTMTYAQIEAVLPDDETAEPLLSPYLIEAFSYETTLIIPTAVHSRTLHRPIAEPYGLDEATGPAYREDPPSTISYGGPAPPLESRKVRPITDTSPQIQDPINHLIKTPWEDVLADKRTVASPCKRTTVLQKEFVPSDVDLGLDDIESVDPATIALATETEKKAGDQAAANGDKNEEEEYFNIDDASQMKNHVVVPEVEVDAINQNAIDIQDEPPKGLVQELTAAIITQLKAEGILSGSGGLGGGGGGGGGGGFTPEMMAALMMQQQLATSNAALPQQLQNNAGGVSGVVGAVEHDDRGNKINLGDRNKPQPITSLGSALLTARVAGMSYDNQVPLRGIKTATMNPYRPVVAEQAKANVWQGRAKPPIGGASKLDSKEAGGDPAAQSAGGPSSAAGALNLSRPGDEKSKGTVGASRNVADGALSSALAGAAGAGGAEGELDLNASGEVVEEKAHISDEEPTLTAEQQKDLFTKCLNNRSRQVEELFSLGVPVNTTDEHGNTCLHVACQCGSKRMVKASLRWGADINLQNKQGQTALHYCFAYRYEQLAAYLVSKGADDTIVNNFGLTCYDGIKPEDDASQPVQS